MVELIPPTDTYLGALAVDEVLFQYEGPRIFTARSTSNRLFYAYIVDEDEDSATETYVYLPVSDARWAQIRSGRLGLRAAVTRPEDGFVFIVTADYEAGRNTVRELAPVALDPEWLPTEDAVLNLSTPTRPDFSAPELGRLAIQEDRMQVAVELEPNRQRTEVSLKTLGRMSLAMQEVIDAVAQEEDGSPTPRGAISREILKRVDLSFTTSMAASFVMVMAPTQDDGLFTDPLLEKSMQRLTALLASSAESAEAFKEQLRQYGPRLVSKLRTVFETAYGDESGLGLFHATREGSVSDSTLSSAQVEASLTILDQVDPSKRELPLKSVVLMAINLNTGSFSVETTEGQSYSGRVTPQGMGTVSGKPTGRGYYYDADLLELVEVSNVTGQTKTKYRLNALREVKSDLPPHGSD